MGVNVEDMVLSKQTHTTNVRVVTAEDKGKGVMRERNYTDVDGMITNVPGICLVTSYADCVPRYFVGAGRRRRRRNPSPSAPSPRATIRLIIWRK